MTARLRYVELVPIDEATTALRTASLRWFQLPRPLADLADSIRSLDTASRPSSVGTIPERPESLESLERLLIQEGSLVPVAKRAVTDGVPVLGLAGDAALCARLRRVDGSGLLCSALQFDLEKLDSTECLPDVLILVGEELEETMLRGVARRCARLSQPWVPFALGGARGWFGPLIVPGNGPDIDDVLARRITTAPTLPWDNHRSGLRFGTFTRMEDPCLAWMTAVAVADVAKYCAGEAPLSRWHEIELDPATLTVTRHLILPLPLPDALREADTPLDFSCAPPDLVDERTGIITSLRRITHHTSIPRELVTIHAHVANMRRISPWFTDPVTAGTSFVSEEQAREAAIGEAVERYCGDLVRTDLLRLASWSELTAAGEHAVEPERLVLFSARQYATPGFPFVPLTRDLPIHWILGHSLTRGYPVWLPASLVYANFYTGGLENTPHVNNPFYPGLAAGPTLEFALTAGIQEVVERHVTMAWWANAHPLPSVKPSPRLAALWSGAPERAGQRAWLIALDNEFDIPVLAGVLENTEEQLFTIGFAARPDPEAAAFKAWAEALTLQDGARDLLDPEGGYRQSVSRGEINGSYMKPWRHDRRYLEDYRPDFHDVVDLMCQLQIYLDPRAPELVRPWVETPTTRVLDDLPRLPEYSLEAYRQAVESREYEIFYADVTTRDVACSGMRVVRVLIPGLIPNYAAAFPFQGRGRVRDVAVQLGWRSTPLEEDQINIFPMPHA